MLAKLAEVNWSRSNVLKAPLNPKQPAHQQEEE